MTDDDRTPPEPSRALAGVAAALPVLALVVGCVCAFPLAAGGDLAAASHVLQMGGPFVWVVLATGLLAAFVAALLVFLAGLGKRVPAAIALFFCCLPWLSGLAGTRYGMHIVEGAMAHADPSSRAALLARGISEAMVTRTLGSATTATLLVATGVALALAALALRAPGRGVLGAVVGALLALPLVGAAAFTFAGAGPAAGTLALAAVGAIVAAALAGGAVGRDAPKHRSGANAAAGATLAGVGFAAAATAVSVSVSIALFGAVAGVDPGPRAQVLAQALVELDDVRLVASVAPVLAVVAALGVTGWAVARGGVSAGRIAGAVAVLLVGGLVTGADAWTRHAAAASLSERPAPVWERVPGFTPLTLPGYGDVHTPHAILAADGLHTWRGDHHPASVLEPGQRASLTQTLGQLAEGPEPSWDGQPPGDGPFWDGGLEEGAPIASSRPALAVAVDANVSLASFRALVDAANDAPIRSLTLVGTDGRELEPAAAEALASSPFGGLVGPGESAVTMLLPASLADDWATDAHLLHATVGAQPTVQVAPQNPASDVGPFESSTVGRAARPEAVVFLELGPDATVASVGAVAGDLADVGYRPLVTTSPLAPPTPPEAAGILGALGDLGSGGGVGGITGGGGGSIAVERPQPDPPDTSGDVEVGRTEVRGSLDRAVIQRVIRRHINEARSCYERQLARSPGLSGRVTVAFVIGPTGRVQSATTRDSTLGDATVEACLARAARRWVFPAPAGGGVVAVNYPFVFSTP